ncbi:hypothetical protein BKA81DRAFT_36793 [Phyllosticta paracitricarpa]
MTTNGSQVSWASEEAGWSWRWADGRAGVCWSWRRPFAYLSRMHQHQTEHHCPHRVLPLWISTQPHGLKSSIGAQPLAADPGQPPCRVLIRPMTLVA